MTQPHTQTAPQARGLFITLEGVDGAGKSTHISWLADQLRNRQLSVLTTREPGGTDLGEQLRTMLLHHAMHPDTETLLMFAARNEHLRSCIEPALTKGTWVVCDRFTDATYAYQGGGRALGKNRIGVLEQWVHPALQPDCTFLFDVDVDIARQRVLDGRTPDRFEHEQAAFFQQVRAAYLDRAQNDPQRFCIIDGKASITDVRAKLTRQLDQLVQRHSNLQDHAP